MTEIEERDEHLAFLTLIERSKRQNALMHLKKRWIILNAV